jgi:hypothetical protein
MREEGERRREDKRREEEVQQQLGLEAASGRPSGTGQLVAGSCCIHRSLLARNTIACKRERERE